MVYKVIGLMSGSSLDGLDIVYTELHANGGKWSFEIKAAACYEYDADWKEQLKTATGLPALEYQLLHTEYGHYLGRQVNRFIDEQGLQFQVALIASHGHTSFHLPGKRLTAQLGEGAAIAAQTRLPVVSDLRALDVAFGGQGAPLVPIGEKLLFSDYSLFLNLGGIANVSLNTPEGYVAFDVCPANRVLNMLAAAEGKEFDHKGEAAAQGTVHAALLEKLNALSYYSRPYPKSLANSFGTDEVYPLIQSFGLPARDALRTYVEHITIQVKNALQKGRKNADGQAADAVAQKLLVTGGGAFNLFLIQRLTEQLKELEIELVVPDAALVQYKEALVMALIGVLRWRQEYNSLASVTGAERESIGGAVWIGQEA